MLTATFWSMSIWHWHAPIRAQKSSVLFCPALQFLLSALYPYFSFIQTVSLTRLKLCKNGFGSEQRSLARKISLDPEVWDGEASCLSPSQGSAGGSVIRPGFALSGSHGMNQTARKLQHLVQAGLSNNKVERNNGNMGWYGSSIDVGIECKQIVLHKLLLLQITNTLAWHINYIINCLVSGITSSGIE